VVLGGGLGDIEEFLVADPGAFGAGPCCCSVALPCPLLAGAPPSPIPAHPLKPAAAGLPRILFLLLVFAKPLLLLETFLQVVPASVFPFSNSPLSLKVQVSIFPQRKQNEGTEVTFLLACLLSTNPLKKVRIHSFCHAANSASVCTEPEPPLQDISITNFPIIKTFVAWLWKASCSAEETGKKEPLAHQTPRPLLKTATRFHQQPHSHNNTPSPRYLLRRPLCNHRIKASN
jgi:hypothetical protein